MFTEARTFVADDERDLSPATWVMPNGETVLVCQGREGYALFTPPEWNNATVASYQADRAGRVLLHGRPVAPDDPTWIVPRPVREHAV